MENPLNPHLETNENSGTSESANAVESKRNLFTVGKLLAVFAAILVVGTLIGTLIYAQNGVQLNGAASLLATNGEEPPSLVEPPPSLYAPPEEAAEEPPSLVEPPPELAAPPPEEPAEPIREPSRPGRTSGGAPMVIVDGDGAPSDGAPPSLHPAEESFTTTVSPEPVVHGAAVRDMDTGPGILIYLVGAGLGSAIVSRRRKKK